jgi:sugar O-acyltransferase (sialic acid O-acetyltransferase NeuD family)
MKTDNTVKNIAIYGAGGYGREVSCLLQTINRQSPQWNLLGFFDDGIRQGEKTGYGEILGGLRELNRYPCELSVAIAIANPQALAMLISQITNPHIRFPNIVAPDVLFLDRENTAIGQGNIIGFKSAVSCNVRIGNFNRFNTDIFLGHDVVIGNCNMFNPSVRISGEVSIGDCNFFGVNSVVLQQKSVGNHTVIGAGSVILRKTRDYRTYTGNPATELKF